jgi:AraC-like DNA-binding protein
LNKRRSYYYKLFSFTFILCLIPVFIIGLYSYVQSTESMKSQVNESNVQYLKHMQGNVEQSLKTIDSNLNQLIQSTLIQDALYQSLTFREFQTYFSIKKHLGNIQTMGNLVSDAAVINFRENWMINNERLYEFNKFHKKEAMLELVQLPYETNWVLQKSSQLGSTTTELLDCEYTTLLVKKMPVRSSDVRGLAIAFVPSCSLSMLIDTGSSAQDVTIVNREGLIIAQQNISAIANSVEEAGLLDAVAMASMVDKSGQLETEIDSKRYMLTYVRSDYNGWLYVLKTDIGLVTQQSRSIGWATLLMCLSIAGLSLVFVWIGTRKMYHPIKRILGGIPVFQPEHPSRKHNEFQIIKEYIENISVSNINMQKELHQNTEQLRSHFLTQLIRGKLPMDDIEEKLRLYGYDHAVSSWESFMILAMQIDIVDGKRFLSEDSDLLLFAIQNIVEESIPPANRLKPVLLDETLVILVGLTQQDSESNGKRAILQMSETIQTNILKHLYLNVSIGISLPFWNMSQSARAYQESKEALTHRLKFGEGIIVHYENINLGKHTYIYPIPQQIETELIDAIKLADEDRANELLERWLSEVFKNDRNPHDYQILLMRLFNELLIVIQESGINPIPLYDEVSSMYEELLRLYVPSEIEKWLKYRIMGPLLQAFRDREDSRYRSLSEEMIDMIQRYYDTPLTLEECASKLHYNAFYLSKVFKKETQMSFSDYLVMYRFKMARKWLIETDMPIKEIAERLQYNNSQNFIRSFRRQDGMTPGQYRTKYGSVH